MLESGIVEGRPETAPPLPAATTCGSPPRATPVASIHFRAARRESRSPRSPSRPSLPASAWSAHSAHLGVLTVLWFASAAVALRERRAGSSGFLAFTLNRLEHLTTFIPTTW